MFTTVTASGNLLKRRGKCFIDLKQKLSQEASIFTNKSSAETQDDTESMINWFKGGNRQFFDQKMPTFSGFPLCKSTESNIKLSGHKYVLPYSNYTIIFLAFDNNSDSDSIIWGVKTLNYKF